MLIRIHVKLHTWFHPTQGCTCRTCMGFVNGNDLHHRKLCTSHTVPPSEDAPSVPACVLRRAHKRVISLAGYARVTQLLYSNSRRWLPQRAHTVIAAVTFGPCFGFRPPPITRPHTLTPGREFCLATSANDQLWMQTQTTSMHCMLPQQQSRERHRHRPRRTRQLQALRQVPAASASLTVRYRRAAGARRCTPRPRSFPTASVAATRRTSRPSLGTPSCHP